MTTLVLEIEPIALVSLTQMTLRVLTYNILDGGYGREPLTPFSPHSPDLRGCVTLPPSYAN
ncbi:MAG: hypothetical protein KF770_07575 [Anaerolineae bacterium]|nr:hypothetical protein [Anaerolineae bacterium]